MKDPTQPAGMNDSWTDRWNERYSKIGFAYGERPNNYLREQLGKLAAGTILFPAEGEGRNAVYAAVQGWNVSAFDISAKGKEKALQLALANSVVIDYKVADLRTLNYADGQFDAIALIYAHFPPGIKSAFHTALDKYLKKGGAIIFEAFSKRHIDYIARNERVGGPKDISMLFSIEEIKTDFANYEIVELGESEITLNEGAFHNGQASVIRFVGRKK